MNKNLLGVDIDNTPKMDGQWYKVTAPLMQTSCETLRTKVLSRIATQVITIYYLFYKELIISNLLTYYMYTSKIYIKKLGSYRNASSTS